MALFAFDENNSIPPSWSKSPIVPIKGNESVATLE